VGEVINPFHTRFWVNFKLRLFEEWNKIMDLQTIRERITAVQSKREYLLSLLEQPNLGTLRIDVNQALEEMDDLIDEFKRTIPGTNNN
jgi:hypothetical protein